MSYVWDPLRGEWRDVTVSGSASASLLEMTDEERDRARPPALDPDRPALGFAPPALDPWAEATEALRPGRRRGR